MADLLIGLTGSVATGKSTVAKMFKELGVPTIDTDKIAHQLMRIGSPEYKKVIALFGKAVLGRANTIDRKKLAKKVFEKSSGATKMRKKLEKILHPAIWKEVLKRAKGLDDSFVIVEVPLLFEVGWEKKVDLSIVAYCRPKEQLKRCKPSLSNRISYQMPLKDKMRRADLVIDTSFGRVRTRQQVKDILKFLLLS